MNIDQEDIERKITSKTKAIVLVHFAGRPCTMGAIMDIAERNNLKVVEDCSHAIETVFRGKRQGLMGMLGVLALRNEGYHYWGGGIAITNTKEYADTIKTMALHGMGKDAWKRLGDSRYKHYKVISAGYKYNMMDIQAAIGIHQLPRVEQYWKRRQEIWNHYNKAFEFLPVFTPAPVEPNTRHAFRSRAHFLKIACLALIDTSLRAVPLWTGIKSVDYFYVI